jgi:hypothetical protein
MYEKKLFDLQYMESSLKKIWNRTNLRNSRKIANITSKTTKINMVFWIKMK